MPHQLEALGAQEGEKYILLRISRDNNGAITDINSLALGPRETLKCVGYNGYMVASEDDLVEYIELENLIVAKVYG